MPESGYIVLIGIGFICGWIAGMIVFYDEGSLNKVWLAVLGGIIGAWIGSTSLGQQFMISLLESLNSAVIAIIKSTGRVLFCGVVLLPVVACALLFSFTAALLVRMFLRH